MKQNEITTLLPALFQRAMHAGSPLTALVEVMERMHAGAECSLEQLPHYLNPREAPDQWVGYLASWFGLDDWQPDRNHASHVRPVPPGMAGVREFLPLWMPLQRSRGTAQSLLRSLRAATGEAGFALNETETAAFHLVLHCPLAMKPHRDLLERLIALQKPAHLTCELRFQPLSEDTAS